MPDIITQQYKAIDKPASVFPVKDNYSYENFAVSTQADLSSSISV